MSFHRLLSENRRLFVWKVYNEMNNNAVVNTPDRKNQKAYFLRIVKRNKELSEIERKYCRERFIHNFELDNAMYKEGKPKECNRCKTTRYSNRYCEKCISLHLRSLFNRWTSGNKIIDDFIQRCQILSSLPRHISEWIPFEEFENVTKLTEGGFSSIYTAKWRRGSIFDYDENKKEFIYFGTELVVLKSLNNSNNLFSTR